MDDKKELFSLSEKCYVLRQPNAVIQLKNLILSVKHGGDSIIIWACFAASGLGQLATIDGATKKWSYKF